MENKVRLLTQVFPFLLLSFVLFISTSVLAFTKTVRIKNVNPVDIIDAPVVVKLDSSILLSSEQLINLIVSIDGKIVSSQMDDLNRDGKPDELVFLVNLKAGEQKKAVLKTTNISKRPADTPETDASLILKTSEGFRQVTEVSSTKNDMYNQIHHHGVAFESALIAYRIYFDNKSTIDIYGKKKTQLELVQTGWYPTEDQLKAGYGDDILLVSDWVGNGTVKGWNGTKLTHIDTFEKRTHRILAKGNIRTVVESEVKGWYYEGKKTDLSVRYSIYARHRDVIAEIRASNDIQNLATGVQMIGGGPCMHSDQLVGTWGSWYPQPDTVKYAKETVGLGLYLPQQFRGKQHMDGVNNILLFPVKSGELVRFHFTTIATKEENQPVQSADAFFNYLINWSKSLSPIHIKTY